MKRRGLQIMKSQISFESILVAWMRNKPIESGSSGITRCPS